MATGPDKVAHSLVIPELDGTHPPAYYGVTDPGAVGAGVWWVEPDDPDTPTEWTFHFRNSTDTGWITMFNTASATPGAHAASHEDGGTDEVTLAQSQITGLVAALAAKADTIHTHSHGDLDDLLVDDHTQYLKTDGTRALTGDQSAGNNKITSVAAPTASGDAANKGYVDALVQGLAWKESARVASTGNVNISNGLEAGDTIDGVVLVAGDRVLLIAQTNPEENGLYDAVASGAASRSADANSESDLLGMVVHVQEGTANADKNYVLTTDAPIVVDTTELDYTEMGGATGPHASSHEDGGADEIDITGLAGVPAVLPDPAGGDDDDVLQVQGGVYTLAPSPGGGGGTATFDNTFLGYNTIGASWQAMASGDEYAKLITVASNQRGLSIQAHVRQTVSDSVGAVGFSLFANNAGVPGLLLDHKYGIPDTILLDSVSGAGGVNAGRWYRASFDMEPGTYWVSVNTVDTSAGLELAYDTGGDDFVIDKSQVWAADGGFYTAADDNKTFSIRVGAIEAVGIDPGSLGIEWVQVLDESGASLANFDDDDGTWVTDGGYIKQTAVSASWKEGHFTTRHCLGMGFVMEAVMKMVASSGIRAIGLSAYNGTDSSAGFRLDLRNDNGTEIVEVDVNSAAVISVAHDWPGEGVEFTLRIVVSGGFLSFYIDGVLQRNFAIAGAPSAYIDYLGLSTYNCEAWWKSIKAWRLSLPEEDAGGSNSILASLPYLHDAVDPIDGDFSWLNQGAASVDTSLGGVRLQLPENTGNNVRGRVKALPSTPFTLTAYVDQHLVGQDHQDAGLLLRDSSGGGIILFSVGRSSTWQVRVTRWDSVSAFNSTPAAVDQSVDRPKWLRITDDGTTNRTFQFSFDGEFWFTILTESRTAHITPNQVGWGGNDNNTAFKVMVWLLSWEVS